VAPVPLGGLDPRPRGSSARTSIAVNDPDAPIGRGAQNIPVSEGCEPGYRPRMKKLLLLLLLLSLGAVAAKKLRDA
jgi:hypothetical protein